MRYAPLADTGLSLSRVVMGCEQLGGTDWGAVREAAVLAAVDRAWDLGINAFDTADVYGLGLSEERLGRALGARRHEAVLITKCGVAWTEGEAGVRARTRVDASAEHLREALEASLRRLRVEAVPLYLVHKPDPKIPLEETVGALESFRQAGKILHFGVSNFDAAQIARTRELGPLCAVELEYSFLRRDAERAALPACRAAGAATLAYGVLAYGLLSGKYREGAQFPAGDRRARLPEFRGEALGGSLRAAQRLEAAAAAAGCSPVQAAIAWVLGEGGVDFAVVGVKEPAQVEQAAAAAELDGDDLRERAAGG